MTPKQRMLAAYRGELPDTVPVAPRCCQDAAVRGSGNFNRLHVRKAQSCFRRNLSPRLATIGIWKPASRIVAEPVEIDRVWVRTLELCRNAVLFILQPRCRHQPSNFS